MGEVYSHLSEEERQVIQIEVGNGASIRGIGAMLGRSPSSISREIKRNTWFPSNENESYRPYRPKRLKAGPWTGRYYIAGPAQRKADRRRSKPRKPYRLSHDRLWAQVAGMAGPRLVAAAHQRQAARPVAGRCAHARRPSTDGSTPEYASGTLGAVPAGDWRAAGGTAAGGRRASRSPAECPSPNARRRPTAGARSAIGRPTASSEWMQPAHRGGEEDQVPQLVPDKTAGESVGAQLDMFSPLPAGARASASRTTTAPEFAHHERLRDGLGMARTSPTRTPAGSGKQREPQRHDPPVSAQTLRDTDGHGKGGQEIVDSPCACSATARPPRRSPTNC